LLVTVPDGELFIQAALSVANSIRGSCSDAYPAFAEFPRTDDYAGVKIAFNAPVLKIKREMLIAAALDMIAMLTRESTRTLNSVASRHCFEPVIRIVGPLVVVNQRRFSNAYFIKTSKVFCSHYLTQCITVCLWQDKYRYTYLGVRDDG
jgi:hypothetical protein